MIIDVNIIFVHLIETKILKTLKYELRIIHMFNKCNF
jgi:hypothetical protein